VVSKARNRRENGGTWKIDPARAPTTTHQSALTSPSRPSGMSTPPTPCRHLAYTCTEPRGFFIYSYHTETEYLVVRTHGPVVTLAYLSVLRQKTRVLPDGNGTKKKSCHVMHMPINLNLGFIWLSTHPVATSLYLSFPLIAIRPSNYDMGEYLFIQLTFKCHR